MAFSLCDFTAACEDHLWLVSAVFGAHSNLGAMSVYRNERPSFYTSAQGAGLFQADRDTGRLFSVSSGGLDSLVFFSEAGGQEGQDCLLP